jgi:hypothetical protein
MDTSHLEIEDYKYILRVLRRELAKDLRYHGHNADRLYSLITNIRDNICPDPIESAPLTYGNDLDWGTACAIRGYGLLYKGAPLLVDCQSSYILSRAKGMPFLVDEATLRYYLSYAKTDPACGYQNAYPYDPLDKNGYLKEAIPCYITLYLQVQQAFSIDFNTIPLDSPMEIYKSHSIIPYSTKSGPTPTTVIKRFRDNANLEDIDGIYACPGGHIDTFICGTPTPNEYLYERATLTPVFYSNINLTDVISLLGDHLPRY